MILFPNITDCCNCNGCTQICPKQAIFTHTDENGFIYPKIDSAKCIECGLCQKVCAYQHIDERNEPLQTYAAISNNTFQKLKSASGGIFAAFATDVLSTGGIVYGAAMIRKNNRFEIRHLGIESIEDLPLLQGSKYVQSSIGQCYKEIKSHLDNGREVLFSGVPCQCAGLKGFLRNKEYPKLTIIDIICHGVPSQDLFNDYINYTFRNLKDIENYKFRDKTKGWGLSACIQYDGSKTKSFPAGTDSYYSLFLDQQTYRLNCYSCKYANKHRPGDLTIGDYWGIEKQHPELLNKLDIQKGVSCIIVNSSKGQEALNRLQGEIEIYTSSYEKVALRNTQLIKPSKMGRFRETIFHIYRKEGYKGLSKFYRKRYLRQRMIHFLLGIMPYSVKGWLRTLKNS